MNLTKLLGGPGLAPGPAWGHQHRGLDVDPSPPFQGGFCSRVLYTCCNSIASCAYIICCCWLIQDCLGAPRDFDLGPPPPPPPRLSYGLWPPAPPEPTFVMPGPPGYPAPPGPSGGPVERPFY